MLERPGTWLEQLFKEHEADIAILRALGVTDSATVTFLIRVRDGLPVEPALSALLRGRSLSSAEARLVHELVDRLLER
jgi:hypothetical protein